MTCGLRKAVFTKNGDIDETIEILKDSGSCYEKDGALWFKTLTRTEKTRFWSRQTASPRTLPQILHTTEISL